MKNDKKVNNLLELAREFSKNTIERNAPHSKFWPREALTEGYMLGAREMADFIIDLDLQDVPFTQIKWQIKMILED